jgi:nucleoside-diphosphate kinase
MVRLEETRERTFIAIKPDGVQRGLVGAIIARFEERGLKLVAMKMQQVSKEHAQEHYSDLSSKPFFNGLCEFICSSPVVAMVWEGLQAVKTGRALLGATNPQDSLPGTIRGDFAIDIGRNVCHGSDSVASAQKEISLWFSPEEISSWSKASSTWVNEIEGGNKFIGDDKKEEKNIACSEEIMAKKRAPAMKAWSKGPAKGKYLLEVTVDKANMKNSDLVPRLDPRVELKIGDFVQSTNEKKSTLTPEWDETYAIPVNDPATEKLIVTVYLGDDISGEGVLVLNTLKKGLSTYKGVAAKGGKLDLTLKATDFGKEEEKDEEGADWMSFM